jgi:hypothetical protein
MPVNVSERDDRVKRNGTTDRLTVPSDEGQAYRGSGLPMAPAGGCSGGC